MLLKYMRYAYSCYRLECIKPVITLIFVVTSPFQLHLAMSNPCSSHHMNDTFDYMNVLNIFVQSEIHAGAQNMYYCYAHRIHWVFSGINLQFIFLMDQWNFTGVKFCA
jgi:hypothetical protein